MISYETSGDILIIKGEGHRYTFTDTINGTMQFLKIAESSPLKKILVDYTEASFHLPLSDSFNLLRYYEKNAPWMRDRKLAVIVHPDNFLLAETWATMGAERGFNIKHFKERDSAINWLNT